MARKLIEIERDVTGKIVGLRCTRCGSMLSPEHFFKGSASHGRRMPCKACRRPLHAAGERKRREAPEYARASREATKRWRERTPEYERERSKRRWRTDPAHRRRVKAAAKRYAEAHPEYYANAAHKRRARDKIVGFVLSVDDINTIFEAHGNACIYCGRTDAKLTIEHLVPPPEGSHDFGNVVPACKACNSSKRDRPLEAFLKRRGVGVEFHKRRALGIIRLWVGVTSCH